MRKGIEFDLYFQYPRGISILKSIIHLHHPHNGACTSSRASPLGDDGRCCCNDGKKKETNRPQTQEHKQANKI